MIRVLRDWISRWRRREQDDAPGDVRSSKPAARDLRPRTDGYFVQIGLDFGTAYLKCVCRDVMRDSAWVYVPGRPLANLPFLIPSAVRLSGGRFSVTHLDDPEALPSPKSMVRMAVAGHGQAAGGSPSDEIAKTAATFLIAHTLADVKRAVSARLQGFGDHPNDYMAVNMAIPVADAERPALNSAFSEVLRAAWSLSASMPASGAIEMDRVAQVLTQQASVGTADNGSCFVYPEVSANVQGFVRSRVSRQGTYLFSDTGASTVDQSIFIFHRHEGTDRLAYLHAAVLDLGSSELELRAGKGMSTSDAAKLRQIKEAGRPHELLDRARWEVQKELTQETTKTLLGARKKLHYPKQLEDIRVIFGGGGHAEVPYVAGTLQPFRGNIFPRNLRPETLEMPIPPDLALAPNDHGWMKRLSVAYGLSFERNQLVPFIYPRDVEPPEPDDIWRPIRRVPPAPTKDEC